MEAISLIGINKIHIKLPSFLGEVGVQGMRNCVETKNLVITVSGQITNF